MTKKAKGPGQPTSERMPDVSEYLALLGKSGRDRISGYAGTIVAVSFDLFGCAQVILKPPIDKDGKLDTGHFFDVNRIEITDHARKMPVPNYPALPEQHAHGPADKPAGRW